MTRQKTPISFLINDTALKSEPIPAIRSRLADTTIRASIFVIFLIVAASFLRAMSIGWQDVMFLQGGIFLIALLLSLFSKKLSFNVKASLVSALLFFFGTYGLFRFGLMGMGIPTLITCCIFVTIFFGSRSGWVVLACNTFVISTIGVGIKLGQISLDFDIAAYSSSLYSWILAVIVAVFFMGTLVVTLGGLHRSLVDTIGVLNKRSLDLESTNEQLKSEITERKQAEEELQKLASVVRYSSELVNLATLDGKMIFLNEAGCKMLGVDPEEVEQTHIMEVIPDHLFDMVQQELLPALMAQNTWEGDLAYLNVKTDEITEVHAMTFTIKDSSTGKPLYLANVSMNITERKRAENALRESEEKFRELCDLLPQVVFETDEKGNLTFANRIAYEFFGYTKEDFQKGLNSLQMIIPEDRDRAWNKVQMIFRGERPGGSEYTALRKDGSTYPAMIYTSPIIRGGKPVGLRGIMADLTNFKQAQEALRKTEEKLIRSKKMEALGLLAGGVAHDLNNVLSGIVSYPELILMDLPDDSKLRKPIKTMQESGQKAAAIVQDLLTVARGVATNMKPLNINNVVREYLNSPEFEKLKQFHPTVTFKTNLDSHLLNSNASAIHIGKVVMNLVSNASEAIERIGTVTISTMNRYVDRPLSGYDDVNIGEYAVLSVSDDGSGISSDDLTRIFDPFYTKKKWVEVVPAWVLL